MHESRSVAFYMSNSTWFHSGSTSTEAIPALRFMYLYWRAETGVTAVETETDVRKLLNQMIFDMLALLSL